MAHVNMSQSDATCPQGLTQRTLSGLTLCGRNNTKSGGCQSTVFSTLGLNYSQVCGQLRGYQFGAPDGFYPYYVNPSFTIDNLYVDGVSITYGSAPRKHIWTYANGQGSHIVPMKLIALAIMQVVTFHLILLAVTTTVRLVLMAFTHVVIYGLIHCGTGSNVLVRRLPAACAHPNMPWFNKTLSETTTEDIELRVCAHKSIKSEDTPLQVIELFVQ